MKRTWREVGYGGSTACDSSAGEVYLLSSPGKGLSLDRCKKACEDTAGCQSITYFKTGWCSHYSTPCTKTTRINKAVAYRFSADPAPTPNPSMRWEQVGGKKTACDSKAGEVTQTRSPGKVSTIEKCKSLCQADAGCKSITYFRSGWCSHFSTSCIKTTQHNKAVASYRLVTG